MTNAWMFPGHGAQYVGMGKALLRSTSVGPNCLAHAEAISKLPLRSYMERGPLSTLTHPAILEPLLAALSIAYVSWLREEGATPSMVAGYSAGELGAMYAANVIDADTALHIASVRGQILEAAATRTPGAMISVSGLPLSEMTACINKSRDEGVIDVAAYSSPLHMTLSGDQAALDCASNHASVIGAVVTTINAAGPWHSRLLKPASIELKAAIADFTFSEASVPVWTSAAGKCTRDPVQLQTALSECLSNTIRWTSVVGGLLSTCDEFLEVGPGHMLWGLLGQFGLPQGVHRRFIERAGSTRLKLSKPSLS